MYLLSFYMCLWQQYEVWLFVHWILWLFSVPSVSLMFLPYFCTFFLCWFCVCFFFILQLLLPLHHSLFFHFVLSASNIQFIFICLLTVVNLLVFSPHLSLQMTAVHLQHLLQIYSLPVTKKTRRLRVKLTSKSKFRGLCLIKHVILVIHIYLLCVFTTWPLTDFLLCISGGVSGSYSSSPGCLEDIRLRLKVEGEALQSQKSSSLTDISQREKTTSNRRRSLPGTPTHGKSVLLFHCWSELDSSQLGTAWLGLASNM